jgi:hypothetical protein
MTMDILSAEKQAQLLDLLISRTESEAQEWNPWPSASKNPFELVTAGAKFSYFIISEDEDDQAPFRFEIWANRADEDEEVDSVPLQVLVTAPQNPLNQKLRALYLIAKKSTLNLDKLAEEIFSDFD